MNVLGIGTEIVECLRIAKMIERHGELFINRVYTLLEVRYCQTRKQTTQHYAGHWAAKEAIRKALGTEWQRGIGWHDIEVQYDEANKPVVGLRGGARDIVVSRGVREILLSISHCRSHAVAYAMAVGNKAERGELKAES